MYSMSQKFLRDTYAKVFTRFDKNLGASAHLRDQNLAGSYLQKWLKKLFSRQLLVLQNIGWPTQWKMGMDLWDAEEFLIGSCAVWNRMKSAFEWGREEGSDSTPGKSSGPLKFWFLGSRGPKSCILLRKRGILAPGNPNSQTWGTQNFFLLSSCTPLPIPFLKALLMGFQTAQLPKENSSASQSTNLISDSAKREIFRIFLHRKWKFFEIQFWGPNISG